MARRGFGYGIAGVRRPWRLNPAALFGSGELGAFHDIANLSTLFQDTAGETPAAVGDPVGRVNDLSGNGNHLIQGTAAQRPILRQDGNGKNYLEFDGVDDQISFTSSLAALADGSTLIFGMQTTDTTWVPFSSGGNYIWVATNGSSSTAVQAGSGTPTYAANQTVVSPVTRDTLHDAVAGADPKVVRVTDLNLTNYIAAEYFGFGSGFELAGKFYGGVVHEGLTADEIAKVESWLARRMAIAL